MDRKQIINYLKIVFDLEKRLYEITMIRDDVENQLIKCENPEFLSFRSVPQKPKKYTYWKAVEDTFQWMFDDITGNGIVFIMLFIIVAGWFVAYFYLGMHTEIDNVMIPSIIFALLTPFLIIFFIVVPVITLVGSIKYKKNKKEHNSLVENITYKNKQIKAMNSQISNINNVKKARLTKELQKLKQTGTEIYNTLMKYYSLNIIYKDYRKMPYIAMFIKYFESGRCAKFEGYDGANNLLERDIKYNNIMSRMDDILQSLESVKYSNSLLYNGIMECNNNISRFSNAIINSANSLEQQISRGVDVSNERLASIEYSNYLIANNTQYLSDLKTFEMLLR